MNDFRALVYQEIYDEVLSNELFAIRSSVVTKTAIKLMLKKKTYFGYQGPSDSLMIFLLALAFIFSQRGRHTLLRMDIIV